MNVHSLVDAAHLAALAKRVALCRRHRDYPREANWVRALANALESAQRDVVLEAEYWAKYSAASGRTRVDIWCPRTGLDAELWAEVKIAERHSGRPTQIGTEPAPKILERWANDVWRLIIGAHDLSNGPADVHCAFVIYVWGDAAAPAVSNAAVPRLDGDAIDADALWASLVAASRDRDPIGDFITVCQRHGFSVNVTHPVSVEEVSGLLVQAIVVEWIQHGRGAAAEVTD